MNNEHIRAVSWWLKWEDLSWPDQDIQDKFKRRADMMAANSVNTAIIFGAHFRWDFMPLWMNLHDMMAFIADELHARNIKLFDHHSSVLTHRYENKKEMLAMRRENRHHVPFAPSRDIAAGWTFNGSKLNDWRMIDVCTGKPVCLEGYTAEEFCFNNPDFVSAYLIYVRRLVAETGIDGLMSDDGIFYSGFSSCGCQYCRGRFKHEYGLELPPVADLSFWGNWQSEAFKNWISMRYRSTGDFVVKIKEVLPKDFPFMTCCSTSSNAVCNSVGLTYSEFIRGCNMVMLEMCGNTPNLDGSLNTQLATQMHHLAIARENNIPCLGLGYGYSKATANLIWAFNKFLGSECWFSTKKGRLGLPDSKLSELPDDAELTGKCYGYEAAHPELFNAQSNSSIAIYFSRNTLENYGGYITDYDLDYQKVCDYLFSGGYNADTVCHIPEFGQYKVLIMASVACLDDVEIATLTRWLAQGGILLASGPFGICDKHGNQLKSQFMERFGLTICCPTNIRTPVFPAKSVILNPAEATACCEAESRWQQPAANIYWHPRRMQENDHPELQKILDKLLPPPIVEPVAANGWYFRRVTDRTGRLLLHGLATQYSLKLNEKLEAERTANKSGINIITEVLPENSGQKLIFKVHSASNRPELFFPLQNIQIAPEIKDGLLEFNIPEGCFYFILRF
jgi:hypothetical protein